MGPNGFLILEIIMGLLKSAFGGTGKKGLITYLQYENDQAYPIDHGTKWYLQFGDYYGVAENCFWVKSNS